MIPDEVIVAAESGVAIGPLYPPDSGRPGVCSCYRGEACEAPAKHPLTKHGKDDFTDDLAQIAAWARRWPGCNWGGRPPEGVVILDVDPRNGGTDSLAALEMEHGLLPRTLTARTGGDGLHFWFVGPTRRGKLGDAWPGLDVKTHTGYVVLPPSVHASGRAYEWLDLRDAAATPNWLHALLNPPRKSVSHGRTVHPAHLVAHVANATDNRNNRLYWAACRIVEQGGDPAVLTDAGTSCGLDRDEVEKTLASALKAHGSTS